MKSNLISDITHYLDGICDGKLKVGHCDKASNTKLESLNIPMNLKRLLQWNWFNKPFDGHYCHYLCSVKELLANSDFDRFYESNLIIIGSCKNGDMIVVDFSSNKCPIYYISHDKFWESKHANPKKCSVLIFDTMAEFMLRLAEFKYVPMDSYTGKEYRELLDVINAKG